MSSGLSFPGGSRGNQPAAARTLTAGTKIGLHDNASTDLWPKRRTRRLRLVLTVLTALLVWHVARAQTRFTYTRGQSVSPAYEGWSPNNDGTFTMFFGYMNANWEQELDIPIGSNNNIEPGGPDRGQPTHFYPRRNLFLFHVRVPKDFGDRELVWTLTANGKTERAYGTLQSDYLIDNVTIATEVGANGGVMTEDLRWNVPPAVRLEGDKRRTVRVSEPVSLVVWISDDGIPPERRSSPPILEGRHPAYTPPWQGAPANPSGLRLSWIVYRGNARHVILEPEQIKTWQDTRPYTNSPWSPRFLLPPAPPDGKWTSQVTFAEPGSYVLRAVASDGALFTSVDLMVDATR
jgi:hypothetical protein